MRERTQSRQAAEQIRDYLLNGIRQGQLKPGDRLPTERALVERFDVARSAVRKVLAGLAAEGLITRGVGRGTEVAGGAEPVDVAASDTSPAELMEARLLFEPALIELVVAHGNGTDFARMEECLDRADRAASVAEFEHWDDALHRAIAAATHNTFAARVLEMMGASREQTAWGKLKQRSLTAEQRSAYQAQHRRIVESLKRRDVERARQRMLEHLRLVRRNMFGN